MIGFCRVFQYIRLRICCDIRNLRTLPRTTRFPHPVGIVIGKGWSIGENCTICQNVTIGRKYPRNLLNKHQNKDGMPVIGDNVFIGAGSSVLGPVKIGNNVIIGAGSLVLDDLPEGTTYTGRKA